tara:strand:+ start:146 stop:1837 length:1692 start_codon:yes stop_codon:yes gene_type:complete
MKNFIKLFKKFNIDGYIVPKNDEYFNEYVNPSNDRLKFISNFTGSAGIAVIFKNKNYLFVDGRYTIQAQTQSGKKFKIIRIPNQTPKDLIKTGKKIIIGFDPSLHTEKQLNFFFKIKNVILRPINKNLVDLVWFNKPKEPIKPFFSLSTRYTGISYQKKILKVKNIILKRKVDYLLVTAPENVAWMLNIRGYDTSYSPIPNSRLLISDKGKVILFTNLKKLKGELSIKVSIQNEKNLEKKLNYISEKKIWIDSLSCSFFYKNLIRAKNEILDKIDPIHFLKSIKNNTEIENMKKTHLTDGVALTKFLFWLKRNYKNKQITEISAQNKLESFRRKSSNYLSPSFNTISGSGPNGAIIHYKATKKTNRNLRKGELYLVDSGGQYFFGTTDVTRTVSLENKSKYIKEIFTRVLKGHIAVSNFKIKKNSTGSQVDRNARKFLKKIKLDYSHGTGHGVGYFLNVHEGPQSLSSNSKVKLKNGMILSNEPGYYKEGAFGIRIENLVYVKRNRFKELTIAPIEKELINKNFLNNNEIKWINNYHKNVKNKLFRFMNRKEKRDLTIACSPI